MFIKMNHWSYESYIGSGSTSFVFKGIWKGHPAALKWVKYREGTLEIKNIDKIKDCWEKNLLLPWYTECGEWFLEDLVPGNINALVRTMKNDTKGPGIVKDRKHKKHKLRQPGLKSCLLVFKLVDGDMENVNLNKHNKKDVLDDLRLALNCLKSKGYHHDDLALRNVFYLKDNGKNIYLLGDFGMLEPYGEYDVDIELGKIKNKFK
ncbi:unnamed protein product [marine sediment metagenome]|uniref:Protein kinase domain-containing protein n=1 Tax=marine sediment metagenome TaxID=412755 RepID=X1BHG6_9ZZZZ